MFSSLGHFAGIMCPEGDKCQLLVCMFSHNGLPNREESLVASEVLKTSELDGSYDDDQRPRKKQKLELSSTISEGKRPSFQAVSEAAASHTPSNKNKEKEQKTSKLNGDVSNVSQSSKPEISRQTLNRSPSASASTDAAEKNAQKSVSKSALTAPPPKKSSGPEKKESLNPRMISKPPAAHAVRFKLLKLVHEQMLRLNDEVQKSTDILKEALSLTSDELVTTALDEEEATAKANASIYLNVMKNRIGTLKKLKLDGWKEERIKQIKRANPDLLPDSKKSKASKNHPIDTKLTANAEIALLPNLVTPQQGLDKHGYVVSAPSNEDVEEASKALQAAKNWEVCDRCNTRFQIFPGRRESDGAVASGGSCKHHWGKSRRPPIEKGKPVKPQYYTCCRQEIGTPGCTTTSTHVFKISDPKRLALILPFENTPLAKDRPQKPQPLCFDCEMGYTTFGMELVRLTAVSWPSGSPLLDILVRPLGEILDLNSRFSGVHPSAFTAAKPWTSLTNLPPPPPTPPPSPPQNTLNLNLNLNLNLPLAKPTATSAPFIVPTPSHARSLLFTLLDPDTPLIGHALENDLNAARIIHPTIIDTVLLYPHPAKLPARYGLKMLVKKECDWEIQMEGGMGHDSLEDARAAGELVRLKVKKRWMKLEGEGWRVEGDVFHAP